MGRLAYGVHHNGEGYFRFVDDILIVYDENKTDIDSLLHCFIQISPKFKFTAEIETEGKINLLDIAITREPNKLSVDIYKKKTDKYRRYIPGWFLPSKGT